MPHPLYLALGKEAKERQANDRELFKRHVDGKLLEGIRQTVNNGMALGNERCKAEAESLTGRLMTPQKMGRPGGCRKDKVTK